jgi:hypothetical protein
MAKVAPKRMKGHTECTSYIVKALVIVSDSGVSMKIEREAVSWAQLPKYARRALNHASFGSLLEV